MCRRSSWRIVNVVIDVDVVGDDDKKQKVVNKQLVVVHHFQHKHHVHRVNPFYHDDHLHLDHCEGDEERAGGAAGELQAAARPRAGQQVALTHPGDFCSPR